MLPALGLSWDVLQGMEGVAALWGWERLLGGGKEQVLSWKWGQCMSAAVSLWSKGVFGRSFPHLGRQKALVCAGSAAK